MNSEARKRIVYLCELIVNGKDSPELLDVLGELGLLIYQYGCYLEGNEAEAAIKRWTA